MNKRYFVASDGRIHGECLVQNPANPLAFDVVELPEVHGSCTDYVVIGGVAVLSPAQLPADQAMCILTVALDRHIDSVALARGYDSRITCAMRAGYVNPWQAEAIAFGQWMDACYVIGLGIANGVKAGTRAIPTEADLIAELPPMVWPT